jgi:signal transduction histidine kinase
VNIARHAKAENVFVLFKVVGDSLHIDIEDDGEGFNLDSLFEQSNRDIKDRRGLGLLGMKERVFLIGGEMEVCSMPGIGTRVDIRIPLVPPEGGGDA